MERVLLDHERFIGAVRRPGEELLASGAERRAEMHDPDSGRRAELDPRRQQRAGPFGGPRRLHRRGDGGALAARDLRRRLGHDRRREVVEPGGQRGQGCCLGNRPDVDARARLALRREQRAEALVERPGRGLVADDHHPQRDAVRGHLERALDHPVRRRVEQRADLLADPAAPRHLADRAA